MAPNDPASPLGPPAPAKPLAPGSPDLRTRILREATRLLAERGYGGTSIREVVEAAGCTKPALYYHFGSKEGLFLACIRAHTDLFTQMLERSVQGPASMGSMLEGLRSFLDHVRSHPTGIQLLWRAEMHPDRGQPAFDFESVRSQHIAMLEDRLRHARDAGEIRRDVDLKDATYALVGMIDQRLDLWVRGGGDLPQDLPERLLGLFTRGVAP
ncbi:MAG: TetR/AcrR family transcriptional regulator [Myxococcota bacterium]